MHKPADHQRTTRLHGIEALQHASQHPGTQLYRWPSLLSRGGAVELEEAYALARSLGPDGLYVDVDA